MGLPALPSLPTGGLMPRTHAPGNRGATACRSYALRVVEWSAEPGEVDCLKCISALGLGFSDEELANDHRYRDPRTGALLVSVTAISGSYDSGGKLEAGAAAAVKLVKSGVDYRQEWDYKRERGTRLHTLIARWALGRSVEALPDEEPLLDAFQAFCLATAPVWVESERAVVSDKGYGGRLDLIGTWHGGTALVDIKTGKPWHLEHRLQVAAYMGADGMVVFDSSGKAVGVEPLPPIDVGGCLYLDESGTATWNELVHKSDDRREEIPRSSWDFDESFGAFCNLLSVRRWAKGEQ